MTSVTRNESSVLTIDPEIYVLKSVLKGVALGAAEAAIHVLFLNSSHDFVLSTGAAVLTGTVVMLVDSNYRGAHIGTNINMLAAASLAYGLNLLTKPSHYLPFIAITGVSSIFASAMGSGVHRAYVCFSDRSRRIDEQGSEYFAPIVARLNANQTNNA